MVLTGQLEELFTGDAPEPSQRELIAALAASNTVVVLGLRADFYGPALRYAELLAAVQAGQFTVGPMHEAEVRAAIVEPARKAGVAIEDELVELLVDERPHLQDGVLPLLPHALYATWRHAEGGPLSCAGYRAIGGIRGAVAETAAEVHRRVQPRRHDAGNRRRRLAGAPLERPKPNRPVPLGTINDTGGLIFALAFRPGGTILAVATSDNTARLWDLTDPTDPHQLGRPLDGFAGYVYGVALSPDGLTLAVGSADRTVRLWNVADPLRPAPLGTPLTGPTSDVFWVTFNPTATPSPPPPPTAPSGCGTSPTDPTPPCSRS